MKKFDEIVRDAAAGRPPGREVLGVLDAAVERYPWFTTARLLREVSSGVPDPLLELHLSAWPRPAIMLQQVRVEDFDMPAKVAVAGKTSVADSFVAANNEWMVGAKAEKKSLADDAIDRFLKRGGYRIVPDAVGDGAEDNAAAASETFDPSVGAVSEQLAEIYLAQRLYTQARDIYERLSLQNPEKSVYFAELIAAIPRGNGGV